MTEPRIQWRRERFSVAGVVGGLPLFSVGYGTRRQEAMYYLGTSLPISSRLIGQHYASTDEAQAAAERLLTAFIERLSGVPAVDST